MGCSEVTVSLSPLRCPTIEVTGIPLGVDHTAPGNCFSKLVHQFKNRFSSQKLIYATRETPDAICRRLNRMLETSVIITP